MLLYTDLATGSVLLPKICELFAISADKLKIPAAIPPRMEWAYTCFQCYVNLRKFDIKSEDYEGQLDRSQRLQRYVTVKNAPTTGLSQRLKLAAVAHNDRTSWNVPEREWKDRIK